MFETYIKFIQLTEEISKIAIKSLDIELKKQNIHDIGIKECFILYRLENNNINNVCYKYIKELYFVGSNPCYIIKKMINNGYINTSINEYDKRQPTFNLTSKGKDLYITINNILEKDVNLLNQNNISSLLLAEYHNFFKKFKNILFNKISNEMIIV